MAAPAISANLVAGKEAEARRPEHIPETSEPRSGDCVGQQLHPSRLALADPMQPSQLLAACSRR